MAFTKEHEGRWDNLTRKRAKLHVVLLLILLSVALANEAYASELPTELVPMGCAVGITVRSQGVIVAEISEIETTSGKVSPARDAGLMPGDVITRVAGQDIASAEDLMAALDGCDGAVSIQFTRDGEARQVDIAPWSDGERSFLGIWIKDGVTGIGTMTFYDPATDFFGALGHPISDSETGLIIPVGEGKILSADITGVTPGSPGAPGRLGGVFEANGAIGNIEKNCVVGIFGTVDENFTCDTANSVEVAPEDDIRVGGATILSAASGEVREYDIEIARLYRDNDDGRGMMIKIVDDELLSLTGGIVQGMSGSPILQDGKLIGAVTHVLINDPSKGYAVSIEDMLSALR